jgi:2-amino-4-hydroxy-6-hydroxymethyldihydropteridine diphosphokinase/dihydropteroate synthase
MGSFKIARWAPRVIDLDILVYGTLVIQTEELTIPHKELLVRPFALFPLGQLLPYWQYPVKESFSFGKTIAELMHTTPFQFDRVFLAKPYFLGILNVTPDSFSDGGQFMEKERAVLHATDLWNSGASLIDIGAASTRPGASVISPEEEWGRLYPVMHALKELPTPPRISIDTYHQTTAIRAIVEWDVDMINFVGRDIGEGLIRQIEEKEKQLICMHSLTLPPARSQVLPLEKDPVAPILLWAEQMIERLQTLGLNKKRLILDPGIGFGKTSLQNLIILKRIKELKAMGVQLLAGHSRKSFMQLFSSHSAVDRDWQSAALSLHLMDAGIDYLRVHDVCKHRELLVAHQSLSVGAVPCPHS